MAQRLGKGAWHHAVGGTIFSRRGKKCACEADARVLAAFVRMIHVDDCVKRVMLDAMSVEGKGGIVDADFETLVTVRLPTGGYFDREMQ